MIEEQQTNQLLGRTEMRVQVKHLGQSTPTRQVLRTELGRVAKASAERVYIRRITTDYGAGISECVAAIYDTAQLGEAAEAEYIRKRHAAPEAKKEAPPAEKAPVIATTEAASPPMAQAEPATESIVTGAPVKPTSSAPTSVDEVDPGKPEAESKPKTSRKKSSKEKPAEAASRTEEKETS